MNIVGGTYVELVLDHNWHELFGSGLRACCVLPNIANIKYYTYVGEDYSSVLKHKASEFNISIAKEITIPKTISFQYLTPLSEPLIINFPQIIDKTIEVCSDAPILRYGMMEAEAICHGKKVIYDPQSPNAPQSYYANGSTAKELAIIMNHREASLLSGGDDPRCLFKDESTKILIVKNGAQGATLYCRNEEIFLIPAFETSTVFSVGSGDVFSAFFAFFWAEKGDSPYEAAVKASKAVALYVSSQGAISKIDISSINAFRNQPIPLDINPAKKRIYLAGPFFTLPDRWFIEDALRHFLAMGVAIFSPFHDIGFGSADKVYSADIDGLKNSDVVFANLCGLDSGTIYEIGYARACGKPVIVFIQNYKEEDLTMIIGAECKIFNDYTSAIYNAVWEALKT